MFRMAEGIRHKLDSGKTTIGSWITLGHPAIAEIMARAGFDWLVVDLEHSTISIDVAGELIRTIDLCGVSPLVRVTSNDANQIKRVLDAGAHGVIVPMVNSRAEAQQAVAAVRYAPGGRRGVGLARAQGYGAHFKEYLEWQAENIVVIVQIEHYEAVRNLKEILTVDGISGYIIGPYDLSCSMGIPGQFENSEFKNAVEETKIFAKQLKIPGGIHIVEPDLEMLKQCRQEGLQFIAYGVDIRILDAGVRFGLRDFREVM